MTLLRSLIIWIFFWIMLIVCVPILVLLSFFIYSNSNRDRLIFLFNSLIIQIIGIKTRITYLDDTEKSLFPVIYTANHVSFFDLFISGSTLPGYPRGFELYSHFNKPFYGWFIKRFGQVPIDPRSKSSILHSMKLAQEKLENNERNFFVMPEGTRTRNGDIGKFGNGAFYLSFLSGKPIVPVIYRNLFSINNPNSFIINPGTVEIVIGKAIYPSQFETKEEMSDYTRNYMVNTLKGLQ